MRHRRARMLRFGTLVRPLISSPVALLAASVVLALGTVGGALAFGSGTPAHGAIAWRDTAGGATTFPACGSAKPALSCSAGEGHVVLSWNFNTTGTLDGTTYVTLSGPNISYVNTFTGIVGSVEKFGLAPGTYTYQAVPTYTTGNDPSGGVTDTFTVPNCSGTNGPNCSSSMGNACSSSNSCGTNNGTIQCDGSCSATAPVCSSSYTLSLSSNISGQSTVSPGDHVSFTDSYTTGGTSQQTNVQVYDRIPNYTTLYSDPQSGAEQYSNSAAGLGAGNDIWWLRTALNPPYSNYVTFQVTISPNAPNGGKVCNWGRLFSSQLGSYGSPASSSSVCYTVSNPATLAITSSADRSTAHPGDIVTFTDTYTLGGGESQSNVDIADTVPPETTLYGQQQSGAESFNNAPTGASAGTNLTWTRTTLSPPYQNSTIFSVKVDAFAQDGTQFCNAARVSSSKSSFITAPRVCVTVSAPPPPPPPPAPQTLTASCNSSDQGTLSWSSVSGIDYYRPILEVPAGDSCPASWLTGGPLTSGRTWCYLNWTNTSVQANLIAGHNYRSYVRSHNANGFSTATAGVPQPFSCPAPDLDVGSVTPVVAVAGTGNTFGAYVYNHGPVGTGNSFYNDAQIDPDSDHTNSNASDLGITDPNPMPALAGGDAFNRALFWHVFSAPGVYYLRVCADKRNAADTGQIIESNENNNCGPWTQINVASPNGAPYCQLAESGAGANLTLTWTAGSATSASINQSVGTVTPVESGSKTIAYPSADTTYTMTVTGAGGATGTCTAFVPGGPKCEPTATSDCTGCTSSCCGPDCGGGGGNSPTCSPASQTIDSGATATWTASGGSGSGYQWYNGATNALLASGATYAHSYTSDDSVYVKDSTGSRSTSCSVIVPNGNGSCGILNDDINANPTRIQANSGTTTVTWTATGVQNSCVITENGSVVETRLPNSCQVAQESKSYTINQQTKFCITCDANQSKQSCVVVDVGTKFIHF